MYIFDVDLYDNVWENFLTANKRNTIIFRNQFEFNKWLSRILAEHNGVNLPDDEKCIAFESSEDATAFILKFS